jgi:alpha-glucosidase
MEQDMHPISQRSASGRGLPASTLKGLLKRTTILTLGLFTLALLGGCKGEDTVPASPAPPAPGESPFRIQVDPAKSGGPVVTVTHTSNPGKVLWGTVPDGGFVRAAAAEADILESRGSFTINDNILKECNVQTLGDVRRENGAVTISGRLTGADCDIGYEMRFDTVSDNQLGFELELTDAGPEYNRVFLFYASSANEGFFGFGEQFTYLDLKGRSFPVITQEQGIFRGKQPFSAVIDLVSPGSAGDWYTTYSSVPQYITSQGRSLFLENDEVLFFDLMAADRVEIKVFSGLMKGRILNGDTPLDLIREFTSYSGRMAPLPDWLNDGAVVGMQGGTAKVYEQLEQLEARGTPIGAFWLQDWVSNRKTIFGSQLWWNWQLNESRYPGWAGMVQNLEAKGIRVMIYMNPSLVDVDGVEGFTRNFYREAAALGYLVKNEDGEPYPITNTDFDAGFVDLTNPDARAWWKDMIREQMLGIGASGWMADYGEALPFDCVLFSGEDPAVFHNRFPEEWAGLNREVLKDEGIEGDVVFFSRAGNARTPGQSTLFWLGDQLVTFDGDDGMKSAIKGMLSGGLSGWSLNHSDIGGFTTISLVINVHRSKELLLRWMEANAFTSVFRTHEGVQPENNVQFYTDDETYAAFARFAKVFKALAFYRRELMQEAALYGYPVARHPMLHYPGDPNVYGLKYQWMVGRDFMVAPVVDEGDNDVNVYLPAGQWVHVWTDQVYGSPGAGGWLTDFPSPKGRPAVFYRQGSEAGLKFVANLDAAGLR